MADNKGFLVVMVAWLDSPLVIQNILEVLEVLLVMVDLSHLLLDWWLTTKNIVHLYGYIFMQTHKFYLFPLEFVVSI